MPGLEVFSTIVGNPDSSVSVLRDHKFQWRIDRNAGSGKHKGSSGLRIAENQQLGGRHLHAGLLGFAAMINHCEQLDIPRTQDFFKLSSRLFNRMAALHGYDPIARN